MPIHTLKRASSSGAEARESTGDPILKVSTRGELGFLGHDQGRDFDSTLNGVASFLEPELKEPHPQRYPMCPLLAVEDTGPESVWNPQLLASVHQKLGSRGHLLRTLTQLRASSITVSLMLSDRSISLAPGSTEPGPLLGFVSLVQMIVFDLRSRK